MSCHDIGRGMDSVTQVVIEMFDNGELSKPSALKLFMALKDGVNWCDGNEYEAVESIMDCRCGKCLKKMESGQKFYDIYDCSIFVTGSPWDILRNYKENYAGWRFCTTCFDEIINGVSEGKISGESARKYIEEEYKEALEKFTAQAN